MSFDLERSLRSLKPQKRTRPLQRRGDHELHWVDDELPIGAPLFLDTSVYLDVLQGRSPTPLDDLLRYRICHHSAVCLAELTHLFGRLNPGHPGTKQVLQVVHATIDEIPGHRLHAPDSTVWGQAGLLAGQMSRLSSLPKGDGHERKFLNDALIYLQAGALGARILTGNIRDFDYLNQLAPDIGVLFYRADTTPARTGK